MFLLTQDTPTLVVFYTDFLKAQLADMEDVLEHIRNNEALQEITVNMVCMNPNPTNFSRETYQKYRGLADFWSTTPNTRKVYLDYNIEEPNFAIVIDAQGLLFWIGNLSDPDCRPSLVSVLEKGLGAAKNIFQNTYSVEARYSRKYDRTADPKQ